MNLDILNETARAMVAPGKGILAADESTATIKKRFDKIGIENSWARIGAHTAICCSPRRASKTIPAV